MWNVALNFRSVPFAEDIRAEKITNDTSPDFWIVAMKEIPSLSLSLSLSLSFSLSLSGTHPISNTCTSHNHWKMGFKSKCNIQKTLFNSKKELFTSRQSSNKEEKKEPHLWTNISIKQTLRTLILFKFYMQIIIHG